MRILVDKGGHDSRSRHHRSTDAYGCPGVCQHRFEGRLKGDDHNTELDELRTDVFEEVGKLREDRLHQSSEAEVSRDNLSEGIGCGYDGVRKELRHLLVEALHCRGYGLRHMIEGGSEVPTLVREGCGIVLDHIHRCREILCQVGACVVRPAHQPLSHEGKYLAHLLRVLRHRQLDAIHFELRCGELYLEVRGEDRL